MNIVVYVLLLDFLLIWVKWGWEGVGGLVGLFYLSDCFHVFIQQIFTDFILPDSVWF